MSILKHIATRDVQTLDPDEDMIEEFYTSYDSDGMPHGAHLDTLDCDYGITEGWRS